MRIISMPHAYLASLQSAALDQINLASNEIENVPVFLSQGDVLLAWWTRHLAPHISSAAKQTITVINVVEIRALLRVCGLLAAGKVYIGNAHAWVPFFMSAEEVVRSSLGDLARRIRHALATLGTQDQLEAFMKLQRAMPKGRFALGDGTMTLVVGTNWTKMGMYHVDFSSAVVGNCVGGRVQSPCRPSLVHYHPLTPPQTSFMKTVFVTGKDDCGNYWLIASHTRKVWTRIAQSMSQEASALGSFQIVDDSQPVQYRADAIETRR